MSVCMLIAGGLAFLANAVGDTVILNVSILVMCSILGLFVFNLPFGKNFSWGCRGIHLGARIDLVVDLSCCAEP